jgi:hypothetical protein
MWTRRRSTFTRLRKCSSMNARKEPGCEGLKPTYSSRLNVVTREKSSAWLRCARTSSAYTRSTEAPVARPRTDRGFPATSREMMPAAAIATSSAVGTTITSMLRDGLPHPSRTAPRTPGSSG